MKEKYFSFYAWTSVMYVTSIHPDYSEKFRTPYSLCIKGKANPC